jgi:hypothetical protein
MTTWLKFLAGGPASLALWFPATLWANCNLDFAVTKAVSAYSWQGGGNFNCGNLGMVDATAVISLAPDLKSLAWTLNDNEVDVVAVADSSGKRCVYNYGPGAHGGSALTPNSTNTVSLANVFVCKDNRVQAAPNTAPGVTIDELETVSYPGGVPITLTGNADDLEDGDLSAFLVWTSSLNGELGVGATITTSGLEPGLHIITAQVADEGGLIGSDSISFSVEAIVVQQCVVDGASVLINGTSVECPTNGEKRVVCSADLEPDADKFALGPTGCCVCNTVSQQCDPNLREGEVSESGLPACPESKASQDILQVPTILMFNNDPYYCFTSGGTRSCYWY